MYCSSLTDRLSDPATISSPRIQHSIPIIYLVFVFNVQTCCEAFNVVTVCVFVCVCVNVCECL